MFSSAASHSAVAVCWDSRSVQGRGQMTQEAQCEFKEAATTINSHFYFLLCLDFHQDSGKLQGMFMKTGFFYRKSSFSGWFHQLLPAAHPLIFKFSFNTHAAFLFVFLDSCSGCFMRQNNERWGPKMVNTKRNNLGKEKCSISQERESRLFSCQRWFSQCVTVHFS